MPQTWQTNGTHKADEVKVDYKDVTPARPAPAEEDKLTKALQKALARFARLVRAHEKRIASQLSAAEIRTLIDLLEKVHVGARSV